MRVPPQPPKRQSPPSQPLVEARISSPPDPSRVTGPLLLEAGAPARHNIIQRFWDGWLKTFASPPLGHAPDSPLTHALQRRQSLAAALLFGLTLLWTALAPISVSQYPKEIMSSLIVLGIGYLTLAAMGWLIRRGWVTGAAMILIALIFAGFLAIQFSDTHGALERATAFYILLYPILLAATLMPAEALFITLVANLFLVAASALVIWPMPIRVESVSPAQFANVYVWPLSALIISTIVAYIWTNGMQRTTAQAEYARSEAVMLRASEAFARQALEHDVHELIRVVDAWTSGNLGAQMGPLASPELRRVAIALGGYASRVRLLARDEYDLQREREMARRVAEAILYYRQGLPVTWPTPAGLSVDLITRAITAPDPGTLLAELQSHNT